MKPGSKYRAPQTVLGMSFPHLSSYNYAKAEDK